MPAARPPEFQRRAVDLAGSGLRPVAKAASDLGISQSCLRRGMTVDDVDAGRREGLTTDERKELVKLRRRTRVLEMENEILKRASAYFARRRTHRGMINQPQLSGKPAQAPIRSYRPGTHPVAGTRSGEPASNARTCLTRE